MSPFHIDSSRIGGASGSQRHNFALSKSAEGQAPKKPRFIQAPPKRDLGQGQMSAPQIPVGQLKDLQKSFAPTIEALQLEIEAAKNEADMVSGPTLRVEPDLYKSISVIGPYFTPQEVRSAILMDARELENIANRLLTGAISSYLADDQKAAIQTAKEDAQKLETYIQQFDLAALNGASSKLAEDHMREHTLALDEEVAQAEKSIVSLEAGNVPVREPMESGIGLGGFLAIGALIAVGIYIADLV